VLRWTTPLSRHSTERAAARRTHADAELPRLAHDRDGARERRRAGVAEPVDFVALEHGDDARLHSRRRACRRQPPHTGY
jgi:hypothetical protein